MEIRHRWTVFLLTLVQCSSSTGSKNSLGRQDLTGKSFDHALYSAGPVPPIFHLPTTVSSSTWESICQSQWAPMRSSCLLCLIFCWIMLPCNWAFVKKKRQKISDSCGSCHDWQLSFDFQWNFRVDIQKKNGNLFCYLLDKPCRSLEKNKDITHIRLLLFFFTGNITQ